MEHPVAEHVVEGLVGEAELKEVLPLEPHVGEAHPIPQRLGQGQRLLGVVHPEHAAPLETQEIGELTRAAPRLEHVHVVGDLGVELVGPPGSLPLQILPLCSTCRVEPGKGLS
jgi:hypothetical protein